MFAWNGCFDAIYIVNWASIVTGQSLKAGSSVIFQPTRSYDTSLERSNHFLSVKKVYVQEHCTYFDSFRQWESN